MMVARFSLYALLVLGAVSCGSTDSEVGGDPYEKICEPYCKKYRACGPEEFPNECAATCEYAVKDECGAEWQAVFECGGKVDVVCPLEAFPPIEACPAEYQALEDCLVLHPPA